MKATRRKLPPYGRNLSPVNDIIRILYDWPNEDFEANEHLDSVMGGAAR